MRIFSNRTRTETEIPSRRQGGRITRAAASVVARFFFAFPRKNFQKSTTFFDNSRKYLQFVYITY